MKDLKFRTPVKCQNGHKAFWYWKPYGGSFLPRASLIQIERIKNTETCDCPKIGLGEGWSRDGDDQMFIGLKDKNSIDIYGGDLIRSFDSHENEIVHHILYDFTMARFRAYSVPMSEFSPISDITFLWILEFDKEIIGSTHLTPELIP